MMAPRVTLIFGIFHGKFILLPNFQPMTIASDILHAFRFGIMSFCAFAVEHIVELSSFRIRLVLPVGRAGPDATKVTQVQNATQKRVAVGDIGDQYSGACFTDVPKDP
jgi:hypothetical protein